MQNKFESDINHNYNALLYYVKLHRNTIITEIILSKNNGYTHSTLRV